MKKLLLKFLLFFIFTLSALSITTFAESECYPLTNAPVYKSVTISPFHSVYENYITYWYENCTETDFYSYRQKLENYGYTMYAAIDNSMYFDDYTDEDAGTTVRYEKVFEYTTEYVFVTYQKLKNELGVRIIDSNGWYATITEDLPFSYNPNYSLARLYYLCGDYQEAYDILLEYINSANYNNEYLPELQSLKSNIEYVMNNYQGINEWCTKIVDYYADGLYYEALNEIRWLRQVYTLSPQLMGATMALEQLCDEELNTYLLLNALEKVDNYCQQGLWYEARDELVWAHAYKIYSQELVDTYNMYVEIVNNGLNSLQYYNYYY